MNTHAATPIAHKHGRIRPCRGAKKEIENKKPKKVEERVEPSSISARTIKILAKREGFYGIIR